MRPLPYYIHVLNARHKFLQLHTIHKAIYNSVPASPCLFLSGPCPRFSEAPLFFFFALQLAGHPICHYLCALIYPCVSCPFQILAGTTLNYDWVMEWPIGKKYSTI